jgi:hypothetical protein
MSDEGQKKTKGLEKYLRDHMSLFAERLQEEAKGTEGRIKEGIRSAVEERKHSHRRFGRPPARRPPSGRPPSGRS